VTMGNKNSQKLCLWRKSIIRWISSSIVLDQGWCLSKINSLQNKKKEMHSKRSCESTQERYGLKIFKNCPERISHDF